MNRKHQKSLSTMSEPNVERTSKKTLTVEDLASVMGGATKGGEEGTVKYGGETKYSQRESRYPAVVGIELADVSIL